MTHARDPIPEVTYSPAPCDHCRPTAPLYHEADRSPLRGVRGHLLCLRAGPPLDLPRAGPGIRPALSSARPWTHGRGPAFEPPSLTARLCHRAPAPLAPRGRCCPDAAAASRRRSRPCAFARQLLV